MDEIIAQWLATAMGLKVDVDIFIDESAADTRNCILVKAMDSVSAYTGIQTFDITIFVCDVVYATSRTRASTIEGLFTAKRGISGSSWGTIGSVLNRYDGTDTMQRTCYRVTCKIGKQEV